MKNWHAAAGTLAGIIALTTASVSRAQQHRVQPCTVAGLPGVDSTWQQVAGSGFTFCLPPQWRRRHPRGDSLAQRVWARSGADSVYWGTGRPTEFDPNAMTTGEITGQVIVRSGENPGPEPLPLPSSDPPCPQTSQTPFLIGQVSLMLTQVACQR